MPFCTQCRSSLSQTQAFCTQCGAAVSNSRPVKPIDKAREQSVNAPLTMGFASAYDKLTKEEPKETQTDPENSQVVAMPSWRAILANPQMRNRILAAVGKSLLINGLLTAMVLIPGLLLIGIAPAAGILWMFLGSFALMARTYSKPWKLMMLTCLVPGFAAVISYLIQWALFSDNSPQASWIVMAAVVGLVVGLVRAKAHRVYVHDGQVMAQRTVMYLVIWAAAYLLTQFMGMFGAQDPLVRTGLLTGAFSTAMLVAVSLVILDKYQKLKAAA